MKKTICLYLALVIIFLISGCDNSYEVSGIENFSKDLCSMGTCDGLLPTDSLFLSDYTYLNGAFRYWTNGDYTQAKAFVRLQYAEDIYFNKKSLCESYYDVAGTQFLYKNFVFSAPNRIYGNTENVLNQGMQMFGYDDATYTLIFIGSFGYEFNRLETITPYLLSEFLDNEFKNI